MVIGSHPGSDAAVSGWVRPLWRCWWLRVTQTAMQTVAGDAMILTLLLPQPWWRRLTVRRVLMVPPGPPRWCWGCASGVAPVGVVADFGAVGFADEDRASGAMRNDHHTVAVGSGWLSPQRLGERFDLGVLLATMRRGLHGVNAGVHFRRWTGW